jgi:hypothetical protein
MALADANYCFYALGVGAVGSETTPALLRI